jgi:hypothetical protein
LISLAFEKAPIATLCVDDSARLPIATEKDEKSWVVALGPTATELLPRDLAVSPMATDPLPVVEDDAPIAIAPVPGSLVKKGGPDATLALSPIAIDRSVPALEDRPTATPDAPAARALVPTTVDPSPMAADSTPTAMARPPLADP